jgi:signal transduction histidine kinase/CHASE1-domain containing sensor protein/ActR/RegA family two-component response regulator
MIPKSFRSTFKEWFFDHLPVILFVASMCSTIWGFYYTHQRSLRENHARFNDLKENIETALKNRLKYYENALMQTKAFFMQGDKITGQDFKIYALNIGLTDRFPGMTAIGYIEYVKAPDVTAFTQQLRSEGEKDFRIWPQEEKRVYYAPVKFIEPFLQIIKEIQGFDMLSNPERREAMYAAAKKGRPTVTEEVDLFIREKKQKLQGFNIFIPVYNARTDPQSQSSRMKQIKGFVFGIFSGTHLFNIILKENKFFQKNVAIEAFLRDDEKLSKVYDSDTLYKSNESFSSYFEEKIFFKVANREWLIKIRSLKSLENQLTNHTRWFVLIFGSCISLCFLLFSRSLHRSKKIIEVSEKAYRKIAHSNTLLMEAGQALGTSLDTSVLLKRLANFLVDNVSDCCVIHVRDSDNPELLTALISAVKSEKALECEDAIESFTTSKHIVNYAYKENKPMVENDSKLLSGKSIISLPMVVTSDPYAVISLIFNENRNFSEDEINLLGQVIRVGSSSIENSLLYKESQMANRLKDEFLATVSHELRTPLTVILGNAKMLLKKNKYSEITKPLKSIAKAAESQSALIEDLLDVSSIISGKVKFRPKAVEVKEVILEAIDHVKLSAQTRDITITFKNSISSFVLGDSVRLQQIIWNLLSNSIKFTPHGGQIEITLKNEAAKCMIQIKDTGKGIAEEFLPHVFEKFRQEEKTSTRTKGGLGLGLSIVASLVELHGGIITVESPGINQGSTFTVSLPLLEGQKTVKIANSSSPEALPVKSLQEVKAMIVDDDVEALDLITRILEGYDAQVYSASNVKEALAIMREKKIDVVISDMAMPELDGYDFIKEVREKESHTGKHLPVLALTAFTQEKDRKMIIESGFDLYLSKPVDPDRLVSAVHEILTSSTS